MLARLTPRDGDGRENGSFPASVHRISDRPRGNARLANPSEQRGDGTHQPTARRIIGASTALKEVLKQIEQVAATDSTVLLLGETGTGKELLASRVHELSARRAR